MRCKKCGRGLGLIHKFCPQCGASVPPEQRKKSLIGSAVWLGVFILLVPIIYYFASHGKSAASYTAGENFTGAVIVALLAAVGLYLLYKLIRFAVRRPVWGMLLLVFFVILPAAGIFLSFYPSYIQTKALSRIQAGLADITAAKLTGDSIMAKAKPADSTGQAGDDAAAAAGKIAELNIPDWLKNYQAAAIIWSVKIAGAQKPADWKKLKNQPEAFPLALSDANAKKYFSVSLDAVERLKNAGADAIKNKDRLAMRQIAANLLVQDHWLRAILYSQKSSAAFNLISPVHAALEVPEVKKGVDVTCSVCDYPDAYKVKWTDELRRMYGCDIRCRPKTAAAEQAVKEKPAAPESADDQAKKYAETLAAYTYKDAPKRAVCIGNNAGGVFCVEEAVASVNEIAASAAGFADNTKALTVDEWNGEYEEIDLAVLSKEKISELGIAPSRPSAEGGHPEGGLGTISQGEPIVASRKTAPKTAAPATQPATSAGNAAGSGIQNVLKGLRGTFSLLNVAERCSQKYYPDNYNENREWDDTMPVVYRVKYGLVEDAFPGTPAQYVDSSGKAVFVQTDNKPDYSRVITSTVQFSQEGQRIKLSGTEADVAKQTFANSRLERICNASYSGYLTIVDYDP